MRKRLYERIYGRLIALGIDFDHLPESAKSPFEGFTDLHFDLLDRKD